MRPRRAAAVALFVLSGCRSAQQRPAIVPEPNQPSLASLIETLSEPGGLFPAENLVSNETSYLQVAERLAPVPSDGVYLGVGPDQNFHYIARLRPRWAFILDIRRQNMLQHLMLNAVFAAADDPFQYLCRLFARPCPTKTPASALASIEATLRELERYEPSLALFARYQGEMLRHVEGKLHVTLQPEDREEFARVAQTFFKDQLDARFKNRFPPAFWEHPRFRTLLLVKSPSGRYGHFLASLDDYRYVRDLERAGRVVPVVGDFAGEKALAAVGRHLRARGEHVAAFYLSNVEFYLFRNGVEEQFVKNLRSLPLAPDSVFIRACFGFGRPHVEAMAGHRSVTLLQRMPRYVTLFDAGRYGSDWDVCTLDYLRESAE